MDVCCPNKHCSGNICLHKKIHQSLGKSDYQFPQCAFMCQVRNMLFEDQTNSFFLTFVQEVQIFEESSKSIQAVIGGVFCSVKYCLNREECQSFDSYVTTPRSIFGCGKYGAWLVVHKVPFTLRKHVKTTKTDKTRFFCQKI